VIEINNVSKKFRIWEDRSRDLKETTINFLRGKKRSFRDLWALRNINLEIKEGETVAFIGENGSGKSTLLKLLGSIYTPDEGKIVARGKISTLLELGVGFHPDLTGEENVYLNGSMLGFDHVEMKARFDEIVSFSEIGDFIYSPIRTYSSGMLMRLGFSIATCVDPDILLVDEILAVGDEAFQKKCVARMEKFKEAEKTIVLVSHSMELVQKFCHRAILLREGRVIIDGPPEKTIEHYHALLSSEAERLKDQDEEEKALPVTEDHPVAGTGKETPPAGLNEGSGKEDQGPGPPGEESFDLDRVKIIETQDSLFFAAKLFQEAFGQSPPTQPSNYVALYPDSKDRSVFHLAGFIHVEHVVEEMGLVGGLCVDNQWRGKGLRERLFIAVEEMNQGEKAFFVYTDNPGLPSECGYHALPHPYLMVKWVEPLLPEEKARLIGAAMAIGPF
jgi:ABC-type polysaccharide/polyol phosphate transport system ATPase subunit